MTDFFVYGRKQSAIRLRPRTGSDSILFKFVLFDSTFIRI